MSEMATLLDQQTGITLRRFTVDEFHRMGDIGLFDSTPQVELLDGLIVAMPPPGGAHAVSQIAVGAVLREKLLGRARVGGSASVTLGRDDEPQPDIVVLKLSAEVKSNRPFDFADVLCAVEIAATSLQKDTNAKRKLYARFGIPDYLVVDLTHEALLHYSAPVDGDYSSKRTLRHGARLLLNSFPDVDFEVAALLAPL